MYNLIFFCVLVISYVSGTFGYDLDVKDSSPEDFPHLALVETHNRLACNGILLSEEFVLTPAYCVRAYKWVKVYLGFSRYPYYPSNQKEAYTQIRESSNIFVHEDYAKVKGLHYLNNIAIIKLAEPATLSNRVKPARLLSRQNKHLSDGRFVNVSGWIANKDTHLKYTTVILRNEDTCSFVYGSAYLRSQELCIRWTTEDHVNLVGNSVQLKDEIIGFQTTTPRCSEKTLACTSNDMILSLTPFLDWIVHTTGIPEAQLTGQIKQENVYEQNSLKIGALTTKLDTMDKRFGTLVDLVDEQDSETESMNLKSKLQQDNISKLFVEISDIRNNGDMLRHSLHEDFRLINKSLVDLYTNQSWFNGELNSIKGADSKFTGLFRCLIKIALDTRRIITKDPYIRDERIHHVFEKMKGMVSPVEKIGHVTDDSYISDEKIHHVMELMKLRKCVEYVEKIGHELDEEEARRNIDFNNNRKQANIKEIESLLHNLEKAKVLIQP